MHILILNLFYYPNIIGGTEVSVKILAETLTKLGNEVSVYTLDGNNMLTEEEINGVRVIRGKKQKLNYLKKIQQCFFDRKIYYDLKNVIKKVSPDVIHTNNFNSLATVWRLAHKMNIPVVHTLRDYQYLSIPKTFNIKYDSTLFGHFARNLGFKVRGCLFKYYTKYVDCVTAPSKYTLNLFLQDGCFKSAKKACVVNCICLDKDKNSIIVQKKIDRVQKEINFMFAGRLEKDKGIIELIDAFENIQTKGVCNVNLFVCGDGSLRKWMIKRIEKMADIHYLGKLSLEELNNMYEKVDVVVMPSIWDEPFGRIIIEANAFGCPVISSFHGGIPEIIDIMKSGIIINPESIDDFTEALIKMSNRDIIKSFIKEIPSKIGYFSEIEQSKRFISLYHSLKKGEIV